LKYVNPAGARVTILIDSIPQIRGIKGPIQLAGVQSADMLPSRVVNVHGKITANITAIFHVNRNRSLNGVEKVFGNIKGVTTRWKGGRVGRGVSDRGSKCFRWCPGNGEGVGWSRGPSGCESIGRGIGVGWGVCTRKSVSPSGCVGGGLRGSVRG
jgi:hypothetical protein